MLTLYSMVSGAMYHLLMTLAATDGQYFLWHLLPSCAGRQLLVGDWRMRLCRPCACMLATMLRACATSVARAQATC